jgi:hypothetical protein
MKSRETLPSALPHHKALMTEVGLSPQKLRRYSLARDPLLRILLSVLGESHFGD